MELDYFISQSSDPLSTRDIWRDSSSLASRSFTSSSFTNLTGINNSGDFSIFFTLDRKNASPGIIFSNWSNTGGFVVGINGNNQLFALASYPSPDSFYFPEIDLGYKNCIGITKSNNRLSVLRYDLNSRKIYESYSKTFRSETNLSGVSFKVGNNSNLNFHALYGLSGISGVFDQLVCFNKALDTVDAEIIFSGFLPIKNTQTISLNRYYYGSSYEQNLNPSISNEFIVRFTGFLNSLGGYIPTGTGSYIANITGYTDYVNSRIFWSGNYISGDSVSCFATGASAYISDIYINYTPPAMSGRVDFTDQIYRSTNSALERLTSHLFSYTTQIYPDVEDYLSYNVIEKYIVSTGNSFTSPTGSYLSGTFMDGIVIDKQYCSLLKYEGKTFEDVGIRLPYDSFKERFLVSDDFVQGYNLYWKSGKVSPYSISGSYIEAPNVVEDASYTMLFDKTNANPAFLNSNFGIATGRFAVGSSLAFGGESQLIQATRLYASQYQEISKYHLIFGQKDKMRYGNLNEVFNNNGDYWFNYMFDDISII
jgi:hypothetical protein